MVPDDLEAQLTRHPFRPLPITVVHGLAAGVLPQHHRDPFDRMLIAQAQLERLTVVTHDPQFQPYGIILGFTPEDGCDTSARHVCQHGVRSTWCMPGTDRGRNREKIRNQ